MKSIIQQKRIIRLKDKNIRTSDEGYSWGKPLAESNIVSTGERGRYRKDAVIAERWLCSDDREFPCFVRSPGNKSVPLHGFLEAFPEEIFPENHLKKYGPCLGSVMKLLDANDEPARGSLSLQVHPPKGYPGLPAKPEMWLSLSNSSKVYLGWNRDYSEEEILRAVKHEKVFECLNALALPEGERVLVNGGMIHAVRHGSFIAEWSVAPAREDIKKGGLKKATASLADNTDGKTPRPGKVNVEEALKILRAAGGFRQLKVRDVRPHAETVFDDSKGNSVTRIFDTEDLVVDEILVSDTLSFANTGCISSCYLEQGDIVVSHNGVDEQVEAGADFLLPLYVGEARLKTRDDRKARLYRWFRK